MFCRIYIVEIETDKTLLKSLSQLLDVPISNKIYIESDLYFLSLRNNEEHDVKKEKEFPNGFIYFKYFIEMDFEDEMDISSIVQLINQVLSFLWKNGYAAVTSCDFEELLLENGGYNRAELPWPN